MWHLIALIYFSVIYNNTTKPLKLGKWMGENLGVVLCNTKLIFERNENIIKYISFGGGKSGLITRSDIL